MAKEPYKSSYSSSFVLIKHEFEYKDNNSIKKSFVFYSLYYNLITKSEFDKRKPDKKKVPFFLGKSVSVDAYEVLTEGLRFRSSTEKEGVVGKKIKELPKGTIVYKAELNQTEKDKTHWTSADVNAKENYVKVKEKYTDDNNGSSSGFIGSNNHIKTVLAKVDELDEKKCTDKNDVSICNIDIKSGDFIGYGGTEPEVIGSGKYFHFEIFTADEQGMNNFIEGNVLNEKEKRNYFRFLENSSLQPNHPTKISGKWYVTLLSKGDIVSKIQINHKEAKVDKNDLTPKGKDGKYSIKNNFHTINVLFDGVLKQDSKLLFKEEILDAKKAKTGKYIVKFEYDKTLNVFWIFNTYTKGKIKKDFFELDEAAFSLLYEQEKDATPSVLLAIIPEKTIVEKEQKSTIVNNETWYYLSYGNIGGWIKESKKFEKISAYKWENWDFAVNKDDPDDFVFDGNEKNIFIKNIAKEFNTNTSTDEKKEISLEEIARAMKTDKIYAGKFAKMIYYHHTEWAGEKTKALFIPQYRKVLEDRAQKNKSKQEIKEQINKKLDSISKVIEHYDFWDKVTDIKNSVKVFHFHPVAFVEHMTKIDVPIAPWMEFAWEEYEYWSKNNLTESTGNGLVRAQEYVNITGQKFSPKNEAWCGCFIDWVLKQTNEKINKKIGQPAFSTVVNNPSGSLNYNMAERYPGKKTINPTLNNPPYGVIVVLQKGKEWEGHVGFLINYEKKSGVQYA